MGWWPPGRSMMDKRRMPRASPGARGSFMMKPSPSGPRWDMAAVITRTRDWVSCLGVAKAAPQIPHTLFFYLRRREKGSTGANNVAAEVKTRHPQLMVGVPGKQEANNKEKTEDDGRGEKEKERFALKQQTPVKIFFPGGINLAQEITQAEAIKGQSCEPYVRKASIIINGNIARDAARG